MAIIAWLGLLLALAVLMVLSRWSLWLALLASAGVLGASSLSPGAMADEAAATLSDPSILLLALAVAMIPLIGGAMESSGMIDQIVRNLRLRRRTFMWFSPSLFGMLPMPGGALLSAPLVSRSGRGVSPRRKTAVNVWFRHALLLIYPLGALLATTKMAGVPLFTAALFLVPGFLLVVALGYIFLLRGVTGVIDRKAVTRPKRLFVPLTVVLTAPLLDLFLLLAFPDAMPEGLLVIAVGTSLGLAIVLGGLVPKDLPGIAKRMRPWTFGLIIITMFIFLNIFGASDSPEVIAELDVPKAVLIVWVGALLGFTTGRIQVPVSILVPIHFTKYGVDSMGPALFAIMYFSVFMGYIVSPVHPCVSVSMDYFRSNIKDFFRLAVPPALIALAVTFGVALVVL